MNLYARFARNVRQWWSPFTLLTWFPLLLVLLLACLLIYLGRGVIDGPARFGSAPAGAVAGGPARITGQAAPGERVQLFDNGQPVGEAVTGPDGRWEFTIPAVGAGSHAITGQMIDSNGASLRFGDRRLQGAFSLDVAAPTARPTTAPTAVPTLAPTAIPTQAPTAVPTPVPTIVPTTAPTAAVPATPAILGMRDGDVLRVGGLPDALKGTAAPNARIRVLDGATLLGEVMADKDGMWSLAMPELGPGDHRLIVQQVDDKGALIVAANGLTIRVEPAVQAAGVVSGTLPGGPGATTFAVPPTGTLQAGSVLRGRCAPGVSVEVYDGATLLGAVPCDASGSWAYALPPALVTGPHDFRIVTIGADKQPVGASVSARIVLAPAVLPATGGRLWPHALIGR